MVSQPFFSILIPNLGISDYLFACLESVVLQKTNGLFNYEIIMCDQSDSDIYLRISKEITNKYKSIKLIHSEIKSLFRARHTLMQHANGEYICFVDSDDYIDDDYLLTIYASLVYNKFPDILITNFSQCDENGRPLLPHKKMIFESGQNVSDYFFFSSRLNTIWRKCFSRNLYNLSDYHNFQVANGEDWHFSFPIMLKSTSTIMDGGIDKYHYRVNLNSMTHKFSYESGITQLKIHNEFYDTLTVITPFQKCLLVENFIGSFISVMTHFLKNRIISYKEFKMLSAKERNYLLTYDGLFSISELSKSQIFIYRFLLKKMYFIIFLIIKTKR